MFIAASGSGAACDHADNENFKYNGRDKMSRNFTVVSVVKKEENPQVTDAKNEIQRLCSQHGMSADETEQFLSRIIYARNSFGSESLGLFQNAIRIIKNRDSFSVIKLFSEDEIAAFFKLAPYGVTPEKFSEYKSVFITPPEQHELAGGMGGSVMNTLGACEFLLKSGVVFEVAIRDIVDIKRLHPAAAEHRFMAIASGRLPIQYAKTFNNAQINFFNDSLDNLAGVITAEKIAELKIADDCDTYKLKRVLQHLLITQKESWGNVIGIINGVHFTKTTVFGANSVPNADYISKVLYSRIFRDQARAALRLPPELLGDECTWFDGEVDVKALAALMKNQSCNPAVAIMQLKELNDSQKWVLVVGGSLAEAKRMYTDEIHFRTKPGLFEEEHATRDLKEFRTKQAENSASAYSPSNA